VVYNLRTIGLTGTQSTGGHPMRDDSRKKFETYFETLPLEAGLRVDGKAGTEIKVDDAEGEDPASTIDTLPRMKVEVEPSELPADLKVTDTLGEGGMGIVRLARQSPLERDVAVKTTKKASDPGALHGLLQEAYVTGHLEHPNVIPIYTLGQDESGAPLIVMKRVEGISWLAKLGDESLDLEYHIDVLRQVANAVRFAHSKGVIHRDIKPENVMIGDFGEVYLLDWGIAVSMDEPKGMMPTRDNARMAGTAQYMAPEMTEQSAENIDARTDVYLMGATLHQIVTGEMLHQGSKLFDLMFSAYKSEPREYDRSVPAELVDIIHKACHRDKEQRYQSAEAFKIALDDFLHHRESVAVSRQAELRLERLESLLDSDREDDLEVHDLFGECRFGFRQALRMWDGNEGAQTGLRRCLLAMARYHVENENLGGARNCIAELADPPQALLDDIQGLEDRLASREQELERLKEFRAEFDLRTAMTSRSIVVSVIGLLWTAATIVFIVTGESDEPFSTFDFEHFTWTLRSIVIVVVPTLLFRKRLFANAANKRIILVIYALLFSLACMRFVMWQLESTLVVAQAADGILYALAGIAVGLMSDRRVILASGVFFASTLGGVFWPALQLHFLAGAGLIFCLSLAWIWRPGQRGA
jgi:serine/threonine-protein kinase